MGLCGAGLPHAKFLNIIVVLIIDDFLLIAVGPVQKFDRNPVVDFGGIFAAVGDARPAALRDEVIRREIITDSLVRLPLPYRSIRPGNDFEAIVGPEEIGICDIGYLIHNLPGGLCVGAVAGSRDKQVSFLTVLAVVIDPFNLDSAEAHLVQNEEDIVGRIHIHAIASIEQFPFDFKIKGRHVAGVPQVYDARHIGQIFIGQRFIRVLAQDIGPGLLVRSSGKER